MTADPFVRSCGIDTTGGVVLETGVGEGALPAFWNAWSFAAGRLASNVRSACVFADVVLRSEAMPVGFVATAGTSVETAASCACPEPPRPADDVVRESLDVATGGGDGLLLAALENEPKEVLLRLALLSSGREVVRVEVPELLLVPDVVLALVLLVLVLPLEKEPNDVPLLVLLLEVLLPDLLPEV